MLVTFGQHVTWVYCFFQQLWNSKDQIMRVIQTIFFSAVGGLVLAYPVTDFGLFDVFFGALVEARRVNCSIGLRLSNNLRVVWVWEMFAWMCVFVFPI